MNGNPHNDPRSPFGNRLFAPVMNYGCELWRVGNGLVILMQITCKKVCLMPQEARWIRCWRYDRGLKCIDRWYIEVHSTLNQRLSTSISLTRLNISQNMNKTGNNEISKRSPILLNWHIPAYLFTIEFGKAQEMSEKRKGHDPSNFVLWCAACIATPSLQPVWKEQENTVPTDRRNTWMVMKLQIDISWMLASLLKNQDSPLTSRAFEGLETRSVFWE